MSNLNPSYPLTISAEIIGTEVVRTNGGSGYVGNMGTIVEIDEEKGRVRVAWRSCLSTDLNRFDATLPRTWVKLNAIHPTFRPYTFTVVKKKPRSRFEPSYDALRFSAL